VNEGKMKEEFRSQNSEVRISGRGGKKRRKEGRFY
jgi:hypothetical protein